MAVTRHRSPIIRVRTIRETPADYVVKSDTSVK